MSAAASMARNPRSKPHLSWRRHGAASLSSPAFPSRGKIVTAPVNAPLKMLLNKVPEVTAIFWVIKILSTTVGETGADYLAVHVGLGAGTTTAMMVSFLF